jgi:hypothetical protein
MSTAKECLQDLCPPGATVWELLQTVSRSGDTHYVRLLVVSLYEPDAPTIQEITEEAAIEVSDVAPGRLSKDGRFKLFAGEPEGTSVRLLSEALYGDPQALTGAVL